MNPVFAVLVLLTLSNVISVVLATGKWFDNVFIIVMENTDFSTAATLSYLGSLAKRPDARLYTNYSCVGRPSQPNYIAMA
ncbi:hypothetical protein HDU93_005933, partial [Gonapodya sp. JEL0774]